MGEALAVVKKHFGPDAVILHTRTVDTKTRLPGRARQRVEITAGRGDPKHPTPVASIPREKKRMPTPSSESRLAAMPAGDPQLATRIAALQSSVDQLLHDRWSNTNPNLPQQLRATYQSLIESQVAADIAAKLVRKIQRELTPAQLNDRNRIQTKLAEFLRSMLPVAETANVSKSGGPHVIALVGATGVGKTTTIAKLAANQTLRHHKTVGLITTDTLRVGAADQLQTYADVIHAQLHIVDTADQMRNALDALHHCNIILIDTPGCGPSDTTRLHDVRHLLDTASPDETHIVLSAEASPRAIDHHIERFNSFGINRIIFTKLDEAVGFGVILNSLKSVHARLAFTTNGQRVPEDITACRSDALTQSILSSLR